MLGAEEPNSPEGGGVSSSSSTSSHFSPPPHEAQHMIDQNLLENGAFDLACPESFTQIMEQVKEEEQGQELVNSDACSTNCTGNIERKRRRTPTDQEEGINNDIVEAVSEIRRTNVGPRRYYALFGLNTSTDDEAEEGQQQNERGEEFGNQDSEQQESGEKENLESEPNEEEETENAGDTEHNRNHQNSEQQESVEHNDNQDTEQQENGNQESEQDNEEASENDENQEENDREGEEESEVDEEEKRKANEKGKRPMSEICKLKFMIPKFSKFEKGGPSDTPEGDQTQEDDANDQLNNEDQYNDDDEDEDHQVLAILKSIWHFNCNNGYFPYPTSDELHNHIMDSVTNLKILGEDLTNKIIALEDNFNTVRALDGDNPDTDRPIHREIFNLSMRLWGNSEDQIGNVEQQNQELYDVNIEQNSTADDLEGWSC
uniref:Protein PFC0760c-like n=1 Tax=Nicotiana tabacum TaxID=4097 RepID=A0A1S3YN79_TOBAC|nr:PREDICTED: protein PFC0760c-like [Nicotiana tabacum]